MPVVRYSQLSATVRQVRQANFFGPFLDYVVNTAPRNRRQILAIRIAWSILHRTGNAHVPLGLRKPRRNLRVVHGPIFAEPIQVCGLEIDVAVTSGRTSPEISFSTSCFAALPIPIGARAVGIRNVVLEEIFSFAVFRFLHRIRLLVSFPFQPDRVSKSAILQVIDLPVQAKVLGRFRARSRIYRTHTEAGFAQHLHDRTAAGAGSHDNHVERSCRHKKYPSLCRAIRSRDVCAPRFAKADVLGIVGMTATRHRRPNRTKTGIAETFQSNLSRVVAHNGVVPYKLKELAAALGCGLELRFVGEFLEEAVLLLWSAVHELTAEFRL